MNTTSLQRGIMNTLNPWRGKRPGGSLNMGALLLNKFKGLTTLSRHYFVPNPRVIPEREEGRQQFSRHTSC